jgi:hypothetical protein
MNTSKPRRGERIYEETRTRKTSLSPRWGSASLLLSTHGLRRGLHSLRRFAAGLNSLRRFAAGLVMPSDSWLVRNRPATILLESFFLIPL